MFRLTQTITSEIVVRSSDLMHNSTGYVIKQSVYAFSYALSSYGALANRPVGWGGYNNIIQILALEGIRITSLSTSTGKSSAIRVSLILCDTVNIKGPFYAKKNPPRQKPAYGGSEEARVALGYRHGQLLRFFRAPQTSCVLHNSIVHAKARTNC